jgi:hypothetical protein
MKTIAAFDTSGRTIMQEYLGARTQSPRPESVTPNDHEHENEEACIANISARERMKRLIGGVIPFVIALAILTWLISTNADRLWRLPIFLLFVSAASGFFQWRDKT